jgi:hypothetical protein
VAGGSHGVDQGARIRPLQGLEGTSPNNPDTSTLSLNQKGVHYSLLSKVDLVIYQVFMRADSERQCGPTLGNLSASWMPHVLSYVPEEYIAFM